MPASVVTLVSRAVISFLFLVIAVFCVPSKASMSPSAIPILPSAVVIAVPWVTILPSPVVSLVSRAVMAFLLVVIEVACVP